MLFHLNIILISSCFALVVVRRVIYYDLLRPFVVQKEKFLGLHQPDLHPDCSFVVQKEKLHGPRQRFVLRFVVQKEIFRILLGYLSDLKSLRPPQESVQTKGQSSLHIGTCPYYIVSFVQRSRIFKILKLRRYWALYNKRRFFYHRWADVY